METIGRQELMGRRECSLTLTDRESDYETELAGNCVLSARNCKILIKQGGHRLSSNAFESLNSFIVNFLQCIGRKITTRGDHTEPTVPWTQVMDAASILVPSLEGWFGTWHTLLTQHATIHPIAEVPCCREIADRCSLTIPEECERILRLSMHPLAVLDGVALSSIVCTMNDVVQWVVRVAVRVVESKGLGTVRKGEMEAVLTKAPIFATLQNPVGCTRDRPDSILYDFNLQEIESTVPYSVNDQKDSSQSSPLMNSPVMAFPLLESPILDSPMLDPSKSQSISVPKMLTPADSPISSSPLSKSLLAVGEQSRIVACTDASCSWIKVTPALTGHFMESRGVETDLIEPIRQIEQPPNQMDQMQREIEILKELMGKLLKTSND
ncbi:hypothetical protein PSACC_02046 [Paramicrosporidium saccamoebae]|uniref:Uncharacterized protein n=1 Tax=Paramicrosporidium saccamoebae TaxID=1246581 RepID=A0A2H9TK51_9FUNG|nr:hypothetical protein PSACC_02046 [Paramicrosporidium saccamoebae]